MFRKRKFAEKVMLSHYSCFCFIITEWKPGGWHSAGSECCFVWSCSRVSELNNISRHRETFRVTMTSPSVLLSVCLCGADASQVSSRHATNSLTRVTKSKRRERVETGSVCLLWRHSGRISNWAKLDLQWVASPKHLVFLFSCILWKLTFMAFMQDRLTCSAGINFGSTLFFNLQHKCSRIKKLHLKLKKHSNIYIFLTLIFMPVFIDN